MTSFFKISWRNIWRNKYRSIITISAISVGLAALIFVQAFVDGAHEQMVKNYTELVAGSLQVHAPGFQKTMSLDKSMSNPGEVDAILNSSRGVAAYTHRIKNFVLVSSSEHSAGALLLGINPATETHVTKLHSHVNQGHFLEVDHNDQIVIGKDLLEVLDVRVGDKIVVMTQGADGSLASGAFRLCGTIATGTEEMDKGIVLINLKAAQDLLVLGDKVSEISVKVKDINRLSEAAAQIEPELKSKNYELITWQTISPIVAQTLDFDNAFMQVILWAFLLVIAIGILNTILMGVLERIREFGVMLALGTRRRQIVLMVTIESVLLGAVGVALGLFLGGSACAYFGVHGVNLGFAGAAAESWYIGRMVYPQLTLGNIIFSIISVLIISTVVSIYPAWKASNLKPREAIRHQ